MAIDDRQKLRYDFTLSSRAFAFFNNSGSTSVTFDSAALDDKCLAFEYTDCSLFTTVSTPAIVEGPVN